MSFNLFTAFHIITQFSTKTTPPHTSIRHLFSLETYLMHSFMATYDDAI